MPFTITNPDELAALPDGTLITWQPVPGDPSSAAVAFVRKDNAPGTGGITWVAPGNGWAPEGLDVVTYPVVVIGGNGTDQPEWIEPPLSSHIEALIAAATPSGFTGGTYPRDVALQAAAQLYSGYGSTVAADVTARSVIDTADAFVDWLTVDPRAEALNAGLINRGIISEDQVAGYFAGGPTDV